jgi:hypothetical protein
MSEERLRRGTPLAAGDQVDVPERGELDPIVKATAGTFHYLAEWFGTEEQRAELAATALEVEALDEQEICCPVCEEVECDTSCPLVPVRNRWITEAVKANTEGG